MSRSTQFRFVVVVVAAIFLGGSAFAGDFVVDDDSAECPAATHATIPKISAIWKTGPFSGTARVVGIDR